jgi:tRNA A-37 threonylcarbamoyl transferase component Bud32
MDAQQDKKTKIWSLDIIKLLDKKLICRGLYQFDICKQSYYMKWVKNKLEYQVGKELEKLNRKEFLIPICLLTENPNDKRPIMKHIYNKNFYFVVTKEMKGKELDCVIPELSTEEFQLVIQKIVDALESAWNQIQFVHGDLHLRNIFVDGMEPIIFDFEHSTMHGLHPKKTFQKDLWTFLTNLALNTKNEKAEVVFQFVDKYFNDREKFQESLYACLPNF